MKINFKGWLCVGLLAGVVWVSAAAAEPPKSAGAQTLPPGQMQVDPQEVNRLMQQMMNDPESLRLIKELQNDPEMQRVLKDPDLVKAVQEQDAARLAQDPKVRALQNNQNVQKLIERNQ